MAKQDTKKELTDFLERHDIKLVDDRNPNLTVNIPINEGMTHEQFFQLIRSQGVMDCHYNVLLKTLELLPEKFFIESRANNLFEELILGGHGPPYLKRNPGAYKDGRVYITYQSPQLPFLGLAQVLLHELGHSIENEFPHLKTLEFPLPLSFYERRRNSLPENIHDWAVSDLLIFFALATEQDIKTWHDTKKVSLDGSREMYLSPEYKQTAEAFRSKIFGNHFPPRERQIEFADAICRAEQERSFMGPSHWDQQFTQRYIDTLTKFSRGIYNPQERQVQYVWHQEGGTSSAPVLKIIES